MRHNTEVLKVQNQLTNHSLRRLPTTQSTSNSKTFSLQAVPGSAPFQRKYTALTMAWKVCQKGQKFDLKCVLVNDRSVCFVRANNPLMERATFLPSHVHRFSLPTVQRNLGRGTGNETTMKPSSLISAISAFTVRIPKQVPLCKGTHSVVIMLSSGKSLVLWKLWAFHLNPQTIQSN